MTDKNIHVDITGGSDGFEKSTKRAGTALDDLDKGARKTGKGLTELERAAHAAEKRTLEMERAATRAGRTLARDLLAVVGGFQVGRMVTQMTMLAARFDTLGVSMGAVGRNAGYTRAEMDGFAADVQRMGITALESRQTVISLAQAEIDLSQASKLARVAQDAAVIGNINSSEALGRLIYGIKSAQVEVLRTIGLNVNFENSYTRLAAQLGKTTAQLTEAEKAQARTNAVMEAGTRIAGTYESAMDTAGKQVGSMQRYVEDLQVKMGAVFQEVLIVGVMGLTQGLKDANGKLDEMAGKGQLQEWGERLTTTLAVLADGVDLLRLTLADITGVAMAAVRTLVAAKNITQNLGLGNIWSGIDLDEAKREWREFQAFIDEIQEASNDRYDSVGRFQRALENRRAALKQDAEQRLQIERDYVRDAQVLLEAWAGQPLEAQRAAQLALARSTGMEFTGKYNAPPSAGGGGSGNTKKSEEQRRLEQILGGTEGGRLDQWAQDTELLNKAFTEGVGGVRISVEELAEGTARLRDEYQRSSPFFKQMAKDMEAMEKAGVETGMFGQDLFDKARADRLQEGISMGPDREMFEQNIEDYRASLDRLISPTMLSRLQSLTQDAELLNEAWVRGDISSEQYHQALGRVQQEMANLGETGQQTAKDIIEAIEGTGRRTSRALAEMAVQGQISFRTLGDAAKEFATELLDIMIYRNAIQPLANAASTAIGGLFAGGGADAVQLHEGGIVGLEGKRRRVGSGTFAGAPRYHTGTLSAGEVPAVLKRGEGVFTPAQMKRLAPAGGPQSVRVEIRNEGAPQQVVSAQPRFDPEGMVISVITRDLRQGGEVSRALQSTYNLRR